MVHGRCLSVANPSSAFVTAETWVSYSASSDWIEAGQAYGVPEGARSYFYWADQRPGHQYYEHDDTAAGPDPLQGYDTSVSADGSTEFYVQSGPYFGYSTGWPTNYNFDALQAGSETYYHGSSSSVYDSAR
jgi:hypothetical protein